MNSMLENTYSGITEDRLNVLEGIQDGDLYFCEGTENQTRFISETVANIVAGDAKHILIYFRKTVATKKAKNIAKRIGIGVRVADRSKRIETIYEVPTDLFALLMKERSFTDKERSAVIHAFLEALDALRRSLPNLSESDLVEYLAQRLKGWDREWVEEAVAFEGEKEWEIPIIVTMDTTELLKVLVEQLSRLTN